MFMTLLIVCGADPTFVVENKCPPAFTVTNRVPAAKAKPVKVTNGFNCGAGFCGANGGAGCPSCPNGNGTCACGAKTQPPTAPVTFALPQSSSVCGPGGCPTSGPTYTPLFPRLFGGRR